jgi:hypothetical protein
MDWMFQVHVMLVLVWDIDGITWVWVNFYYIERIKQLFFNYFRSAPSPFTLTSNGLHRHVWAIPFSGSDYQMPAQSIWCGSTPEISKAVA